ncbi:hypothetical protein TNCV_2625531 [Trichonephila clavipes]|nr:hypothetical protein TNCV_2625531 [Trichonephila clavipes]
MPQLRAIVQKRREKELKQQHFNGIESILMKDFSIGVQNYDQMSSGRPDSGIVWNFLRSGNLLACQVRGPSRPTGTTVTIRSSIHDQYTNLFLICKRVHPTYSGNGLQRMTSGRIGVHKTFRSVPSSTRLLERIFLKAKNSMQHRCQAWS